jgi:hypothetical protein
MFFLFYHMKGPLFGFRPGPQGIPLLRAPIILYIPHGGPCLWSLPGSLGTPSIRVSILSYIPHGGPCPGSDRATNIDEMVPSN